VIPQIAPATVALPQLRLLHQTGHRQGEGSGEELVGVPGYPQHVLHLRDHLVGLAVLVLVVDATGREDNR